MLVSRDGIPFGGILSAEGVKQGDVLASLLFSLSVLLFWVWMDFLMFVV